jgi:homoserine dehydrogenase
VEGHDVQAKIALLAKLAFGVHVPLDQIPTKGISSITRCGEGLGDGLIDRLVGWLVGWLVEYTDDHGGPIG